jgi:Dihaem cytochrome c
MNAQRKRRSSRMMAWAVGLTTAIAAAAGAAASDLKPLAGTNPAWSEECGSCHLPYPPQLLPPSSWHAIMNGLNRHFGTDASVDAATAASIRAFLTANAGRERSGRAEAPLLRITETAWFRHEHSGAVAAAWNGGQVRSPADCAACHRRADTGDFGKRSRRLPS